MKTFRVTVRRVERTEVMYAADIGGVQAESEEEAIRKAAAVLELLPGVENERWSESEAETTLDPPEIDGVEDEAGLAAWLREVREATTPPAVASDLPRRSETS